MVCWIRKLISVLCVITGSSTVPVTSCCWSKEIIRDQWSSMNHRQMRLQEVDDWLVESESDHTFVIMWSIQKKCVYDRVQIVKKNLQFFSLCLSKKFCMVLQSMICVIHLMKEKKKLLRIVELCSLLDWSCGTYGWEKKLNFWYGKRDSFKITKANKKVNFVRYKITISFTHIRFGCWKKVNWGFKWEWRICFYMGEFTEFSPRQFFFANSWFLRNFWLTILLIWLNADWSFFREEKRKKCTTRVTVEMGVYN